MASQNTSKKKKKIVGTGLTGLVGSRIVELLSNEYEFIPLGIDIRDRALVQTKIAEVHPDYVLHLAAKTDVDGCEKEKHLGSKSEAWEINVQGTQNIIDACTQSKSKLIFISTDFVFSGDSPHSEADRPNPINYYGETKLEAEKRVLTLENNALVVRISFPFRAYYERKEDIVRMFISALSQGKTVRAVKDQIITPTFIDDIAYAIRSCIDLNTHGILHVCGNTSLSPYDLAMMIKNEFSLSGNVESVEFNDFYKGRADRPLKSVLSNGTIAALGIPMHSIEEALEELKKQKTHI